MKTGRNDPCPCGSGKKFKKCCISKEPSPATSWPGGPPKMSPPDPAPGRPSASAPQAISTPPDPLDEAWGALWREFEAQDEEGRRAIFLRTLDDQELMTDETSFELLNRMREEGLSAEGRAHFAEVVRAFADRRPELYEQDAHYYLSWLLEDSLEGGPQKVLPLARELGSRAVKDIDNFNKSMCWLAYHGQLEAIVEAMRIGWPSVKSSSDVVPRGILRFAKNGIRYEIYNNLEHMPPSHSLSGELLDRIKFFDPKPNEEVIADFISDLSGQVLPPLTLGDYALKPKPRKRRSRWDEEENEVEETPDPGTRNLNRLISQFIGYLHREEGVPFTKGELVGSEIFQYFYRREAGELAPRLSMLNRVMHPKKKMPPPPKPSHPLCPERVTFDVFLSELLGFLSGRHLTAALFELVPSWLRFLESCGLIDAERRAKTLEELRPLHATLLRLLKNNHMDSALLDSLQIWPAVPSDSKAPSGPLVVGS